MKALKFLAVALLVIFSFSAVNAQHHHRKVIVHHRHHVVVVKHHR